MTISDFGQIYAAARAAARRLREKGESKRTYENSKGGLRIEGWRVFHLGSYSREDPSNNTHQTSEYWGEQDLILGSDGKLYYSHWDKEEHYTPATGVRNVSTSSVELAKRMYLIEADKLRSDGLLRLLQSMGR